MCQFSRSLEVVHNGTAAHAWPCIKSLCDAHGSAGAPCAQAKPRRRFGASGFKFRVMTKPVAVPWRCPYDDLTRLMFIMRTLRKSLRVATLIQSVPVVRSRAKTSWWP